MTRRLKNGSQNSFKNEIAIKIGTVLVWEQSIKTVKFDCNTRE